MNLRAFLDAAYAVLVEEYQRGLHLSLFDAVDQLNDWRSGGPLDLGPKLPDGTVVTETSEASQNEAALQQLRLMLGGT